MHWIPFISDRCVCVLLWKYSFINILGPCLCEIMRVKRGRDLWTGLRREVRHLQCVPGSLKVEKSTDKERLMADCCFLTFSSYSLPDTNTASLLFCCTLIKTFCLSTFSSHIPLSIHHSRWPAQVIKCCNEGFVALIRLIMVVSYNLAVCREDLILQWLYLTLATECARVCAIPLSPPLTSTRSYLTLLVLWWKLKVWHFTSRHK